MQLPEVENIVCGLRYQPKLSTSKFILLFALNKGVSPAFQKLAATIEPIQTDLLAKSARRRNAEVERENGEDKAGEREVEHAGMP